MKLKCTFCSATNNFTTTCEFCHAKDLIDTGHLDTAGDLTTKCNCCGQVYRALPDKELIEEVKKIYDGSDESLSEQSAIEKLMSLTYWPERFAKGWFDQHIKSIKMKRPDAIRVGQTWKYKYYGSNEIATFQVTDIKNVRGEDVVYWSNGDSIERKRMLSNSFHLEYISEPAISFDGPTIEQIATAIDKKATDVLLRAFSLGMAGINLNTALTDEQVRNLTQEIVGKDFSGLGTHWFSHETGQEYYIRARDFSSQEKITLTSLSSKESIVVTKAQLFREYTASLYTIKYTKAKATDVRPQYVSLQGTRYGNRYIVSGGTHGFANAELADADHSYHLTNMIDPLDAFWIRKSVLDKEFTLVNQPPVVNLTQGAVMNKKEIVSKVLKLLRPEDCIFGGYVRDFIAGEDFKDVDVFLYNKRDGRPDWKLKNDFVQQLVAIFGKDNVRIGRNKRTYNGVDDAIMKQTVYVKQAGEADLQIDLVSNQTNEPFIALDADVNGLLMRGDGKIETAKGYDLDLTRVKRHIEERVFQPIGDNEQRIQKLFDKGYTMFARIGQEVRVHNLGSLPMDYPDLRENQVFTVIDTNCEQGVCIDVGPTYGHNDHENRAHKDRRGWWIFPEDFELVEEKEKDMSNVSTTVGFVNMTKEDATDAAYRIAARTMTKGVRSAALQVLRGRLEASVRVNGKINRKEASKIDLKVSAFEEFLDSEFGSAMISCALGYGLTYVPMVKNDPRAKTLAKEFRVLGMATAGNAVVDIAMESFVPVILQTLQGLPEPKKVRIAETQQAEAPAAEHEDEQEEVAPAPVKRAANH
ncbi:MAG TPA: hypothetical protein VM577_08260 [Anaerovoracaceae bacterium]|nr:hypothetical protein [Anaerovoracaceae bacterium]